MLRPGVRFFRKAVPERVFSAGSSPFPVTGYCCPDSYDMSSACRLYLITPPEIRDPVSFRAALLPVLDAVDIAFLQLRMKRPDGTPVCDDDILRTGEAILPSALEYGVRLLVNDRPDLARKTGAHGVHVGQSDASCRDARSVLGPESVVGVTCHDSGKLALAAENAGADYVAFGSFFPTRTKKVSAMAVPDLIGWWKKSALAPCVAIGGITPGNCKPLVRAGADFLAVSSGVWTYPAGPVQAVRDFARAFGETGDGY